MDNAGNCNTTATEAALLLPHFRGMQSQTRCICHIFHLIAKAFLSFFFKEVKRKKAVKIAAGAKRKRGHDQYVDSDPSDATPQDALVEDGEQLTPEEEEIADVLQEEDQLIDDGQVIHDKAVVATLRDRAIAQMKSKNIIINSLEEKSALSIFPKAAGLAKKVHDSNTLSEKFSNLLAANIDTVCDREKRTLDRRVPTRWNSDFQCLETHVYFRTIVEQLTAPAENKLRAFKMSEIQWDLALHLVDILAIFEQPTRRFSQSEVPLVHETIPMLSDLEVALTKVRDAADLPNVIRVAAHASLLVCQKYFALTDECEVYRIAIVMCPDRKLKWFRDRGWSTEAIEDVRQVVNKRWKESYEVHAAPSATSSSSTTNAVARPAVFSSFFLSFFLY
ncbi:hypothetical protein DFH11DRAFT_728116 [Phellopilus nigrolimitatus]|nr:hypothetical protein DFH11DRAFT_728116 [Phellopilus nigrolimitatus]